MSDALRRQITGALKDELELIMNGEPIEACKSTHRLLAFVVRGEDGELQWTSRRVDDDGVHDVTGILATVDVTLYDNDQTYVYFLGLFTGQEVPSVDDNGRVDPDWVVDGSALAEAEEEAWEIHSAAKLEEWVDEAIK